MSAASEKEIKYFNEFKSKIQGYLKEDNFLHDDHYLKKWLIARDYNVNKAEKMFLENMEFRKKYNVDEIMTSYVPNEILKKYTTGGIIGYDKEGSVVRVECFGLLDMKGIMYSVKTSDIEKMKILECETVVKMWKEWNEKNMGSKSDGMTVIFDMEKVTSRVMWRPGLTLYLHLIKLLEDNYPEMLKKLLIINSPSIFPFLWKICKPLVSDHTKKKIQILQANYKVELLKFVDESVLPVIYGGSRTDSDGNPLCKDVICQGGIVPIELYRKELENINDAVEVQINAGNFHYIKKIVEQSGSILRWEFKTSEHDLGYGLRYYENEGAEPVYLIPLHRVNCHMVPEDGSHVCEKSGIYELVFDNSYSVARAKNADIYFELLDKDDTFKGEITIL